MVSPAHCLSPLAGISDSLYPCLPPRLQAPVHSQALLLTPNPCISTLPSFLSPLRLSVLQTLSPSPPPASATLPVIFLFAIDSSSGSTPSKHHGTKRTFSRTSQGQAQSYLHSYLCPYFPRRALPTKYIHFDFTDVAGLGSCRACVLQKLLWLRYQESLPKVTSPCGPWAEGSLADRASKDTGRSSGQPRIGSPGTWEALNEGLALLSPCLPLPRTPPFPPSPSLNPTKAQTQHRRNPAV